MAPGGAEWPSLEWRQQAEALVATTGHVACSLLTVTLQKSGPLGIFAVNVWANWPYSLPPHNLKFLRLHSKLLRCCKEQEIPKFALNLSGNLRCRGHLQGLILSHVYVPILHAHTSSFHCCA